MSTVRLLALAASFRPESLNKKLLAQSVTLAKTAGAEVTELDYAALDTPTYRGDGTAIPEGAKRFADALVSHQGLILSTPEYNWSMPGSLKNLIDWVSTDTRKPLQHKMALLLCASPSSRGGISGLQQLRVPLEVLGCWVYPQLIGIGKAGEPMKPADAKHLEECVTDFVAATNRLAYAHST